LQRRGIYFLILIFQAGSLIGCEVFKWTKIYRPKNKIKLGVLMKVSEFLGRKVLDKKAIEIGKVFDLDIKPKEGIITGMTVSTSEYGITRKEIGVKTEDIDQAGDYVLLKVEKAELELRAESVKNNEKRRLEVRK
jgi:sporulation protein YlmC with PRC-barrel domain